MIELTYRNLREDKRGENADHQTRKGSLPFGSGNMSGFDTCTRTSKVDTPVASHVSN